LKITIAIGKDAVLVFIIVLWKYKAV